MLIKLIFFNKLKNIQAKFSKEKKICVPHLLFVRITLIFRPELMFSYFTPKLQMLGT